MTALTAISCRQCGGAIQARPGQALPGCLFCGAAAAELVSRTVEGIEPPVGAIPFEVSEAGAREAFVAFARSSFWYPGDLRKAEIELTPLLLPAWAYAGRVETHWTGLVSAATQAGKRPVSGRAEAEYEQVLIVASTALTQAELSELGAYREALEPFDPEAADVPYEVSELTRSAATARAHRLLQARHAEAIQASEGLLDIRTSALVHDLTGKPVLVPVLIGAYRYREHPYRVLVHGQTGHLVGEAPISYTRVAAVVLGGLLLLAVVVAILGGVVG